MPKRSSTNRSKDENVIAKSIIDDIIEETESEDFDKPQKEKNPAAVALGRLGGKKGGKARAENMTSEERKEQSRKAAEIRWAKYYKKQGEKESE